jgi:HSP20 family protein
MLVRRVWPSRPTFETSLADFELMRRQMLRLFDASSGEAYNEPEAGVFPPVNLTQDADNFYVRAQIPGVDAKRLEISAHGRRLSISGGREIAKEDEKVSYHRKERAEGAFSRSLTLPHEFEAERVDAHYRSGILTVTLPKSEAAKPRQIQVKS